MAELVMLDLPAGPAFVEALQRVWDTGDAAFPLDQRLPESEAQRVRTVVRPTAVIGSNGDRRNLDGGEPLPDGDALVVATSGTTGDPKAVIHTHTSVQASAHATSKGLGVNPHTDRWLACLPPAHVGGLSVITRSLITGTELIVHERFDPSRVDQAARDGATLVSLVTRALNQVDVGSFRKILIGGAAPPPDLPDHIIPTYGMTETGSGCVYGRFPLDGVELRAVETGEIQIRGELLLRAYRTATGEVDPRTTDGWFPTGDLGQIDPDGRLSIDGRAGDMIITGGENVWPDRTERVLVTHPGVAEVAVIGLPDPDWGHRVVACIVAGPETPPSLEQARDLIKQELPAWYAPRELVTMDQLPKTALGKVRKQALHADIAARFG